MWACPAHALLCSPVVAACVCLRGSDAYLSHSWRDAATLEGEAEKWRLLQQWRSNFKAEHGGHEPTIWFDKACLDQGNIDASLTLLPCYLAGCKKLVIIAGETYTSRLWW